VPIVPIAIGAILLIALIAIIASSVGGGNEPVDVGDGVEQTRPVVVEGGALAPYEPRGSADPALGRPAPELEGASFDGDPVTIRNDGTPKVLVFLSHSCPHCRAEVPVLVDWIEDHGMPDDVDLYGISTNASPDLPNYPPSAWLADERWTAPTIADDADGSAGAAFGLTAFPYFVAVDGAGTVAARITGELSIDQWEAFLDAARG
jgi:hypothetical protein